MEELLEFAKGPLFRLTFMIMVLGLLRHIVLTIFEMRRALSKAADPVPPFGAPFSKLSKVTLSWLIPINHLKNRMFYSITSILFHIGVIIVPIFLYAHIQLWEKALGFGWPALSSGVADVLTLLTIVTGIGLFIGRLADSGSQGISRPQDYLMTWLIILPFVSGFLATQTNVIPISYTFMMLVHVLSAELVFVLIPFTKITHCVLYPVVHFASNYAWRFVPQGGEKVINSLGKEGRV